MFETLQGKSEISEKFREIYKFRWKFLIVRVNFL